MYLLIHTIWNGTVPIKFYYSAYATKELAEKVKNTLNNPSIEEFFTQTFQIEEIDYYKSENEISILNK